ncbi:MAG: hypothetical protein NT023_05890 [Armatimonadetes bacterium]|nr:hypothetical protein [Armatimonadota bacterium]
MQSVKPPPRPTALPVKPDDIPQFLKDLPRWLVWRYSWKNRKWTKIPYNARTGGEGSSTNERTWSRYEEALRAYQTGEYDGIGFALSPEVGITGIDLDKCRNVETGELTPLADTIIGNMGTYTEVSPSGTGLRLFVMGSKPAGRCKDDPRGVEIYNAGRYLTITGHALLDSPIRNAQDDLNQLHAWLFPEKQKPATAPRAPQTPSNLNDRDLIEKATQAKNGSRFANLWRGNWQAEGYGSQSNADEALCYLLSFWTGGDASRIDALFRQSGLMRDKWDERRGAQLYGEMTVDKAATGCATFYTPTARYEGESGKTFSTLIHKVKAIGAGEFDDAPEEEEEANDNCGYHFKEVEEESFDSEEGGNNGETYGTTPQEEAPANEAQAEETVTEADGVEILARLRGRGQALQNARTDFNRVWAWAAGVWYNDVMATAPYGTGWGLVCDVFSAKDADGNKISTECYTIKNYGSMVSGWQIDGLEPHPEMPKNVIRALAPVDKSIKEKFCHEWEERKYSSEAAVVKRLETEHGIKKQARKTNYAKIALEKIGEALGHEAMVAFGMEIAKSGMNSEILAAITTKLAARIPHYGEQAEEPTPKKANDNCGYHFKDAQADASEPKKETAPADTIAPADVAPSLFSPQCDYNREKNGDLPVETPETVATAPPDVQPPPEANPAPMSPKVPEQFAVVRKRPASLESPPMQEEDLPALDDGQFALFDIPPLAHTVPGHKTIGTEFYSH